MSGTGFLFFGQDSCVPAQRMILLPEQVTAALAALRELLPMRAQQQPLHVSLPLAAESMHLTADRHGLTFQDLTDRDAVWTSRPVSWEDLNFLPGPVPRLLSVPAWPTAPARPQSRELTGLLNARTTFEADLQRRQPHGVLTSGGAGLGGFNLTFLLPGGITELIIDGISEPMGLLYRVQAVRMNADEDEDANAEFNTWNFEAAQQFAALCAHLYGDRTA